MYMQHTCIWKSPTHKPPQVFVTTNHNPELMSCQHHSADCGSQAIGCRFPRFLETSPLHTPTLWGPVWPGVGMCTGCVQCTGVYISRAVFNSNYPLPMLIQDLRFCKDCGNDKQYPAGSQRSCFHNHKGGEGRKVQRGT